MRNFFYAFVIVAFGLTGAHAQMNQGNSFVNLRVGLIPLLNTGKMSTSVAGMEISTKYKAQVPPVSVAYEYAVSDRITVGGTFGYANLDQLTTSKFTNPNSGETITSTISTKYNFFFFGGIGNYYILNEYNYNLYAGLNIGYSYFTSNTTDDNDDSSNNNGGLGDLSTQIKASGGAPVLGLQVGGRYFFGERFAVNMELGYGASVISLGISYKLGY